MAYAVVVIDKYVWDAYIPNIHAFCCTLSKGKTIYVGEAFEAVYICELCTRMAYIVRVVV